VGEEGKKSDKSKLRRCAGNERKKEKTARLPRLLRAEKVILAVETERGHYALDAPEMSRPADESSLSLSCYFLVPCFFPTRLFFLDSFFNGYL
jgi:hypothetical protein